MRVGLKIYTIYMESHQKLNTNIIIIIISDIVFINICDKINFTLKYTMLLAHLLSGHVLSSGCGRTGWL